MSLDSINKKASELEETLLDMAYGGQIILDQFAKRSLIYTFKKWKNNYYDEDGVHVGEGIDLNYERHASSNRIRYRRLKH